MLRSDNARLSNYVYVDVAGRSRFCHSPTCSVPWPNRLPMPPAMPVGWSAGTEYLWRASERLRVVVPLPP